MWKLGKPTLLGRHAAGVTSVRISPSDQRVFSSSLDGKVRVRGSRKAFIHFPKVRLYPKSKMVPTSATTLAINHKYLVCGMYNGTVELYSPADGQLIRKLPNPPERSSYRYNFHTVTTHPANPEIIAGSNGSYLVIWSAADGEILWRQTSFRLINTVRFLRGGQYLMAHEWDPWIHLWDFHTRRTLRLETSIMETSANWATACAAPPESKLDFVIATVDADGCRLVGVNLDHRDPIWEAGTEARVHDLCFLPDGRHLLTGGESGVLELWDTEGIEAPQQLDVRSDTGYAREFSGEADRSGGLILTTPTLDGEFQPPWTIHTLEVASDGSFAALGMAAGMVIRVALENL
jgi:WD40 repeat protein